MLKQLFINKSRIFIFTQKQNQIAINLNFFS